MKNTRVYDWPTRIFHWLFAGSFVAAFVIAKYFDDESAYFPVHMLLGLVLVGLVSLRVVWGFIGSRYARFSAFRLRPAELAAYFKNLLTGKGERFLGHNPASSWAAITMMALTLGLGTTGYLMTTGGNMEFIEEVHELLGNVFVVVVIAHVAGILLHTLIHRDWIGLSMIHGGKRPVGLEPGIARSHGALGLLFLSLVGGFVFHLNKNYDPTRQTLNFLGSTLQLGEAEGAESGDDD
ncbi:MAG: cytochrome b/b6 domain-containing protein [Bdellovibrionales bacterium]|nr:cytochrome b/b6 domain-containing protein [Bdellovibrionales bacterium]